MSISLLSGLLSKDDVYPRERIYPVDLGRAEGCFSKSKPKDHFVCLSIMRTKGQSFRKVIFPPVIDSPPFSLILFIPFTLSPSLFINH